MSRLLLQKHISTVQWGAILTLVVGVVLVQLRPDTPGAAPAHAEQAHGCERSIKIKLKIKKNYFENKSNTILKIKDLEAKIK